MRFLLVKRVLNILLVTKIVKNVRPLCILLPKMSEYGRDFDETKCKFFLIKGDELFEKYNEIRKMSAVGSKKNFVVNLYTMKNIYKLK